MNAIRKARTTDVPTMAALVNEAAERGLMLHRSLAEMYEGLRDFHVACDEDGRAVGLAGLRVMWANLAEVYALVVGSAARGRGVGKQLVEACVKEAEAIGVRRLFALTYEKTFFERCGFAVVDRVTLPLKVWSECVRCPKYDACDEIAMVRIIETVPDTAPAVDPNRVDGDYTVPVTIRNGRNNIAGSQ